VRILFNCIVNAKGGAVQNAANFISIARLDRDNSFRFIVSRSVYEILELWGELDDFVYLVGHPFSDSNVRKFVSDIEKEFNPDVVYTMAGPSYLKFRSTHVLGVSDAYTTHAKIADFFYGRSFFEGINHFLKCYLKGVLARIEGDFFVFQTETSRCGFSIRFLLKDSRSEVIPNSIGKSFLNTKRFSDVSSTIEPEELRLLCPAADYPHKDLFIIERIARLLSSTPDHFKLPRLVFYVTVDEKSMFAKSISKINRITEKVFVKNKGPFSYTEALEIYNDCDIVFMPSVLETFSTSYLEALASNKTLLVADKEFSREICLDAAYYFSPKDASSALEGIKYCLNDGLSANSVNVDCVLNKYGNYEKRYLAILTAIVEFYKLSRHGVDNV